MFERFTERARRAVVLATIEADRLGAESVGTEHLLLGLVREGRGVAARALRALDVSSDAVRSEIPKGARLQGSTEGISYTEASKRVFDQALREAMNAGDRYIDTQHVLLALLQYRYCRAMQVLNSLGVPSASVRREVDDLSARIRRRTRVPVPMLVGFVVRKGLRPIARTTRPLLFLRPGPAPDEP
jgi:ATP-dependent Clp protease ATP-binding subunit ClpC